MRSSETPAAYAAEIPLIRKGRGVKSVTGGTRTPATVRPDAVAFKRFFVAKHGE